MSQLERLAAGLPVQGEREADPIGSLKAFGAGLVKGIPFADEIYGLMALRNPSVAAKGIGAGFEAARTTARDFLDEQTEGHPVANVAGQLASGVALPLGGAAKATTLPGKMVAGARAGAVGGGLTGAGAAEGGIEERLTGGVVGAGVGALAGGLLPTVPALGGKVADWTGMRLPTRPSSTGTGIDYRYTGPASIDDLRGLLRTDAERAADDILRKLDQGEIEIPSLRKRDADAWADALLGQRTKPETLLDVGGQAVQRLGRAVRTTPGKGSALIDEFMANRAAGAEERIVGDLLQTTGQGTRTNRFTDFDELVEATKANAKPLYDEAYRHTVTGPTLKEAMSIPAFRDAYEAGRRIATLERRTLPTAEQALRDGFPVEAVDYMKRGVDAVIETGAESGRSMSRTEARALRNRLSEVLAEVDEAVPAFRRARAQFAGDKELEGVVDIAKQHLTRHPDLSRKLFDELSEAGKAKYRQHAFEALAERIESIKPGHDISGRIAERTLDKQRLRLLFPDDASFSRFQDLIKREATMNASRNMMRGGSQTADKLAELADLAGVPIEAMLGGPGALVKLAGKAGLSRMVEGTTQRRADALADMLTAETGSPRFSALLEEIAAAQLRAERSAASSARTSGAAGRTTGGGAGGLIRDRKP